MSKVYEISPVSTRIVRSPSQYKITNGRKSQHLQSWAPGAAQTRLISEVPPEKEPTESGSCKKYFTTKLVISILVGLVICGIPLAAVSSLYAQKIAVANVNSSSSGTSSNSVSLPSQCSTYISNSDATRLITFTGCTNCLYDTSSYFTAGWYRFLSSGGNQLASTVPSNTNCGASAPAWYNGSYPSTSGGTVTSFICVNNGGNLCDPSYLLPVSITNCNGYYVYYLSPTSFNGIRYCTSF